MTVRDYINEDKMLNKNTAIMTLVLLLGISLGLTHSVWAVAILAAAVGLLVIIERG